MTHEEKMAPVIDYAAKLQMHLNEIFNEDAENYIDRKDFQDEDKCTAFFHALATVMPANLFKRIVGQQYNHLEFNHLGNQLVFQYAKIEE